MKLYIIESLYHMLITITKAMVSGEKFDLYIDNEIAPDFPEFKKRLAETGLFGNIYDFDGLGARLAQNGDHFPTKTEKLMKLVRPRKRYRTIFDRFSTLSEADLRKYSDIYVFCTTRPIERFILYSKIPFHLIEDGLDFFLWYVKQYRLKKGDYTPGTLRFFLRRVFAQAHYAAFYYAIDIEVNDISKIKIPKDRVFEVPRKALFGKLSDAQKLLIYKTFATDRHIEKTSGKCALLCTRPLYAEFTVSEEGQAAVVRSLVGAYTEKGYYVVIKPHPRDLMNYVEKIPEYNFGYIDKNLPSEILNFNSGIQYDVAIGIETSSIDALECAAEKVFIGRDYIEKVLNNEETH